MSDLIVQNLSITPNSGPPGSNVNVSFTIYNQGSGTANANTTNIRIKSTTGNPTTSDPLLASLSIPSIAAGGSYNVNQSVTIPASSPAGVNYIWVILDVDSTANQSNEDNDYASATFNVTSSLSVTVTGPSSGNINTNYTFTATASGGTGSYSYSWSSDGFVSSSGNSATYRWSTAGTKTVTCTVTSGGVTASGSATISVGTSNSIARIEIDHTYRGDLYVVLGVGNPASPYWSTIISNYEGGSADNIYVTVDISTASAYLPPSNTYRWYLYVYDGYGGDTGQIKTFNITHNGTTYTSTDTPVLIYDGQESYAFIPSSTYTLTTYVSPSGSGTITLNPSGGTYPAGTVVTLTANASTGYHFVSWSGDLTGTSTTTTMTMNSNKTVTANFAANIVGEPKSIHTWLYGPNDSDIYNYDIDFKIDAWLSNPDPNWLYFWSMCAYFTDEQGNSKGAAHGGLQWASGGKKANWGGYDLVGGTQSVVMNYNWQSGKWYRYRIWGLGQNADGSYNWGFWILDYDTNIETYIGTVSSWGKYINNICIFTETGYGVSCDTPTVQVRWRNPLYKSFTIGGSNIIPTSGLATYNGTCSNPNNTDQRLISSNPIEFIHLTNTVRTTIPNTYLFNISTSTYTLTTYVSPSGSGTVTLNPSGGTYTAGTVVTLTANASAGYHFVNWSGDLTGTTTPATITMDSDKTVAANFEEDPYFHHFEFNTIPNQTAGIPFNITITAKDQYGNTYTGFNGSVTLSVNKGTITPTTTINFVNGVLSNFSVTIPNANTSVTITATGGGKQVQVIALI